MSHHIVEIGTGNWIDIDFQNGDSYLGTDPLFGGRCPHQHLGVPLGVKAHWDDFLIGDGKKHLFRRIQSSNRGPMVDFSHFETQASIDAYKDYALEYNKKEKKTIALDAWLEMHAENGFTERIDFLHCNVMYKADIVWKGFSFRVKPKVILIRVHETLDLSPFYSQGYKVYKKRNPIIAIR